MIVISSGEGTHDRWLAAEYPLRVKLRYSITAVSILALLAACSSHSSNSDHAPTPTSASSPHQQGSAPAAADKPLDWKALEAPLLTDHVQLTKRSEFVKAGEAYFDHHSPPRWVAFQAVPVPAHGQEADPFYSMYVAQLRYDGQRLAGIN